MNHISGQRSRCQLFSRCFFLYCGHKGGKSFIVHADVLAAVLQMATRKKPTEPPC